MTGILEFIGNPTVQSTALITMAITALLAALPKPGTISIKNTVDFVALVYKFIYYWATGFWSMKTRAETRGPYPTGSDAGPHQEINRRSNVIFSAISNAAHTFVNWVEKEFTAIKKAAPTLVAVSAVRPVQVRLSHRRL